MNHALLNAIVGAHRALAEVIQRRVERDELRCKLRMLGGEPEPEASIEHLRAELELRLRGCEPIRGASAHELREQLMLELLLERLTVKEGDVMDKLGSIATFETDEDAKSAGYKTKLAAEEAEHLRGLNRHERRAELARMRCAARKAKKRAHAQ